MAGEPTPTPGVTSKDLLEVVRLLPDVLFRCHKRADGKIYWSLNEGGLAEQFHLTTKEIEGKSLEDLFPGGASSELKEHFEAAFRGEPTIFTNEIAGRHFRHFPQPVFGLDGTVKEVVGFIAEVTELVETERRLAAANADLEAFAHSVSHDLRNPLSVLMTDAKTLQARLPDGSREHAIAGRVGSAAKRMSLLVEGLLAMSRAARGPLQRTPVALDAMAREVADDLGRLEPDRRVEWGIEDGLTASADATLARDLMQNLLYNAWKFTRDRSPAHIRVAREHDRFVVSDDGIGFDAGVARRIFEPFERGHDRTYSGHGIGLATVRRIVERHGGTIEAEGRPGEGATFRFTLEPPEGGGGADAPGPAPS